MEFLLLRHAPTDWNRSRRIQGRTDQPLSAEGRAFAASWVLPAEVKGWSCASSPLKRALDTARAMGLTPVPCEAFIEMDWGGLEGRTLQAVRAEGGERFAANEQNGADFRPPGGESPREVGARALAGLRALPISAVIVTHKGVLRALFALATDWDMRSKAPLKLIDAACHRFAVSPGGSLRLVEANVPLVRDFGGRDAGAEP